MGSILNKIDNKNMSHFTNMKTRFQNLFYLEKALSRLKIEYKRENLGIDKFVAESENNNLIIAQPNGYDIKFCWNGQEYELVVDLSYWKQPYPIESFIDESQKIGFQPIKYQQNEDGSNTLVLERWNGDK